MFSEVLCFCIFFLMSSQSSGLMSSLILVPLSICYISSITSYNSNSSMILIVYALVFIGGLLVLLVSVASISSSEQGLNLPKMEMFLLSLFIPLFLFNKNIQLIWNLNLMITWFSNNFVLLLMLMIMSTALIVISKNIVSFKGMVRVL